jgi:hypothetical protein
VKLLVNTEKISAIYSEIVFCFFVRASVEIADTYVFFLVQNELRDRNPGNALLEVQAPSLL